MNLITIIVTVYNKEKYIEKCLKSIFSSTCLDFDLIIVDDASTDNSKKLLKKHQNNTKNQNIKIYYNDKNRGLSFSKNFAVSKVKTKYFIFVDADDYIEKNLVRKAIKVIMKQEPDLISFNLAKVKDEKIFERVQKPIFDCLNGEEVIKKYILSKVTFDPSPTYVYNKKYYDKNKFVFPIKKYHEDFGTTPLIILKANKVVCMNYYGYYYVQTENSIIRSTDYDKEKKKAFDVLFHYDNLFKEINEGNYERKTKDILNIYIFQTLINKLFFLNKKDKKEFKRQIRARKIYKRLPNNSLKKVIKNISLFIDPILYNKIRKIGS